MTSESLDASATRIGFTGTRHGMRTTQQEAMRSLLSQWTAPASEFHHGDCIGADAEASAIAFMCRIRRVVHPPLDKSRRAFCDGEEFRRPRDFIDRNHDIVNETAFLIATPRDYVEELRSGTWSTIRYAKKQGKPVWLIWPDGSMTVQ